MKEPVDHILRPRLPWRSPNNPVITECGYSVTKVNTMTRDDYHRRIKDLGEQRTAMVTCMTCSNTVKRWSTWDEDPRKALGREIEWETGWRRQKNGSRLKDELLAIAALIAAHPTEFAALVHNYESARLWKEALAEKRKTRDPGCY